MSSIYQKYRPQTFEELVDQDHIKITLENEIKTDQISHAYLFSGPRGVGKTTCARLLAKIVNCQNKKKGDAKPCNKCAACKEISKGKSLDVMEIDAASQTGVDNVRENIIENSRFVPHYSKYKIFIIDEAHMLSISAFNALLKILEEPPAHIIFILATTEIHKIPETIISRCQQFNFKKINFLEIEKRLNKICLCEKIKVDPQILKNIAHQSQGYLRDAESLLGQILVLGEKKISLKLAELILPFSNFNLILELLDYLFKKNKKSALILINNLVEKGIDLKYFINDCIEIARKILLIKIDVSLNEFSQEMDKKIEKKILELAKEIKTEKLSQIIEIFIKAQKELGETDIIQLPLEIAVLKIIGNTKTIEKSKIIENTKTIEKSKIIENTKTIEKSQFSTPPANLLDADADKLSTSASNVKFNSQTTNYQLTLEEIKEKWAEILEEIKKYNHSIFTFLRTAELISLGKNVFTIGFKYKFYQERINDRKNKEIIENVLENILKQKIILKIEIISEEKNSSKEIEETFLSDILNVFNPDPR
jgi:DNA polymerase-3 subunit gamma/tau